MPHANRLTLHILAAVAEHEREMISQPHQGGPGGRQGARRRLGNPRPADSLAKGRAIIAGDLAAHRARVRPLIEQLHSHGLSFRASAEN